MGQNLMRELPSVADLDRIIEQARAGSHEAFAQLVRFYQGRLRTYLARFVGSRDQADDLAQEAFLAAYRGLSDFKEEGLFSTWLLGIARNHALMHLREVKRRAASRTVPLDSAVAGYLADHLQTDAAHPQEHDPRLAALEACMESLAGKAAVMVRDFYFKRRAAAEIARDLRTNEGAVWMGLVRIRQSLRECMQRRLASEAGL